MSTVKSLKLVRISAHGIVQGVGFRPFVYQLAKKYGLTGWVCNTSEGVKIEAQGESNNLERFLLELQNNAPPLAYIAGISATYFTPGDYETFEIRHSVTEEGKYQLISPDIATCQACISEIFDPEDRRHLYPFTNCTNCGPRFTIIEDIPYDRAATTMHKFIMCPDCQAEYDSPLDRRFHAQPNACPVCGPQLELLDSEGNHMDVFDILGTSSQLIKDGKIVAIKGLGGFLLACDATNEGTVKLLRKRKQRPSKPLAIMVANMNEAMRHCYISQIEKQVLLSPQSPIVLMRSKLNSAVCKDVAPNLKYLGLMLPYTPLHHILLSKTQLPLVMTSGNLSEEPIARDNIEAVRKLSGIADYFLVHNRDIYATYDDSVVAVEFDRIQIHRRARGYAPYPIHLDFNAGQILACGAELNNTFCLTRDNYAFISQHIGDMENPETVEQFENTVVLYKKLFRIEPEIIAHDLHPDYQSAKYALHIADRNSNIKRIPVQHHHAHIVSCMIDNSVEGPVIGVALDGTGYGIDGKIWGGEFMIADRGSFERLGHIEYLPLPGGDAAIKRPYRTAVSYLLSLLGEDVFSSKLTFLDGIATDEVELIKKQVRASINCPSTSSMGRLFDAVSALIGLRNIIEYDAQAAIDLEMVAYAVDDHGKDERYPFSVDKKNGINIILLKELISAVVDDLFQGTGKSTISAKFHSTISVMVRDMCQLISGKTGINQVALSGGVFQNRLLQRMTMSLLKTEGFSVFTHNRVPCNDGGISLGQAVVANYKTEE